jgi:transposase-like protein
MKSGKNRPKTLAPSASEASHARGRREELWETLYPGTLKWPFTKVRSTNVFGSASRATWP